MKFELLRGVFNWRVVTHYRKHRLKGLDRGLQAGKSLSREEPTLESVEMPLLESVLKLYTEMLISRRLDFSAIQSELAASDYRKHAAVWHI